MGSVSIWHLLVLIFPILLIFFVARGAKRQVERDGRPVGIYGWLVWLAIGLVLAPIQLIVIAVDSYQVGQGLPAGHAARSLVIFGVAGPIFLALLACYEAFLFFRKRARTVPDFVTYSVLSLIYAVSFAFWLAQFSPSAWQETTTRLGGAIIISLIWIAYLYLSKRVANTFVN